MYNMEKYIGRCLDSLLIPELNQVEVLVVNDGSKDRSSEIAHIYENNYPDSIRVIDKKNGNYGSCVNRAMKEATGRYLKILDSDDYFDKDVFSEIVKELPNVTDDVLITLYEAVDEGGNFLFGPRPNISLDFVIGKTYTFEEAFKSGFIPAGAGQHPFCYNRFLLERAPLELFEGISFSDGQWATKPLAKAKTVRFMTSKILYKYFFGRPGQTMNPTRERELIKDRFLLIWDELNDFKKNLKLEAFRINFLSKAFCNRLRQLYGKILNNGYTEYYSELEQLDKELHFNHQEAYNELSIFTFAPHVRYYPVKHWRKKGYSVNYNIPKYVFLYNRIVCAVSRLKQKLLK